MSIGSRVKQARNLRGLSQRDLAELVGVSAQAISKYERDLDVPGSKVIIGLSKALDVGTEYFFRQTAVTGLRPVFRKLKTLPKKEEYKIMAEISDWLERYLTIESIRSADLRGFKIPRGFPYKVNCAEDVEEAAISLRKVWKIGLDPIESLISILEDQKIKVFILKVDKAFSGCTFFAENQVSFPVIAVQDEVNGDRQRFTLAHELAHLLLDICDSLDEEKICNNFAGAFLVPKSAVFKELGEHRNSFSPRELYFLKHKYGLSMQAWLYRANELEIISNSYFRKCIAFFSEEGWRKKEPGLPYSSERPTRFYRLVLQAFSEGLLSERRAVELLGKPLESIGKELSRKNEKVPLRFGG